MFLFKRNFKRKLSGLLIIYLIVLSFGSALLVNIKPVSAEINISLKWTRSAGTGSTYLGPLAVDLNNDGLMEIVITGTSGVAALNPITGSLLWRAPYGGYHSPPEIIDLNKDGTPEVVFCASVINGAAERGVVAIHGNNGSVYWINRNAASGDNYLAVADINADGYPEIYTVQPGKITALTYDGQIFASTYTYYSCWGGLSVGDTNFDGVFEVYLGERSESYPSYPSGGRGLRAFWADNLTEIWAYPDILCSSQAPVLADVNRDGDLEIIILNQGNPGGIAVINTDGSIYRKQLTISGLTAHSNPSVADIDDDGNLELITNGRADHGLYLPNIWDLVQWKLDATLPFPSDEPPGLADVDGDGKWEIINCNAQNVTIFKYNAVTNSYDIVYTIPLANASPFSIAQDIDNDGKLELVFGVYKTDRIYVYDVEAPAPSPRPRSGLYFYSQYRTRVPEYIPPPGPPAPKITEVSPPDGSTNVPITLSGLSFKLTDFQSDPMNVTVSTSTNIGSISLINVPNNKYTVPISGLAYSTTYTWTVTATDGTHTTTKTFTFTTSDLPPWYNTDWQYRRTIMIDHTKVSGDQTNFPVLIDITDSNFIAKAQPDGDDFVFTDQDNNKLNHQIEYYDNTAGRLIAWVNIPYLSSTADTKIYLYYGNPTCGNQQNPKAVWDTSNKLVLHLNEKSGTHYDSTAYGNNGTPINGVQQGVNAKIDGGDTFDGTNDYIEIAHNDTLAGYTEAFTASFWIRLEDTSRRQAILNKYNTGTSQRGWFIEYNPVDRPTRPFGFYASQDGTNYSEWYASFVPLANTWYYVTVVWEANAIPKFYINGALVATVGTNTISLIYNNVGVPLHIARCTYNTARYFKGSLDEIRISNPARSAGYILTSYNNQLNPAAFYTISPEEGLPDEPLITNPYPAKDATNIPITLNELSFDLTDYQHDLMNVTVTTNPNIGSLSLTNVPNDKYNVSINGLAYATIYNWTVTVTDGTHTTTKTYGFITELAPPADDIIFNSNFDMGNLINVTYVSGAVGYRYYIAATNYTIGYDPVASRTNNDKHWWFYFSMENVAGKTIAVSIVNGTDSDWSTSQTAGNRWPEIEPVYSYDNINWYRVPLSGVTYDRAAKRFTINITIPVGYNKIWLAPLPPYNIARRDALFAEFADSPYLTVTSLGTTPGGQQLKVATITDPAYPDAGKFRSYVIAQQHNGEVPGSWNAEGLIRFLLSDDPTAAAIRRSYIFRIVPIVNVDGVYYGLCRYTPVRNGYQYDLNRQWSLAASGSTSSYLQPEIKWIWQDLLAFKPHSFNDMHSTINTEVGSPKEALTYTWSTSDPTIIAFRAKIKQGGWPETVTGTTSYAATVVHNSAALGNIKESVSWENPHDELSTNPGVKLTVNDWMAWGAGWARGNYLYFGDAQAVLNVTTVGSGSVVKNPDNVTYAYGTSVQLTAIASVGYTFSHWEGDLTGDFNPATIVMTGNKTVTAIFVESEYTLTINVEGSGTVSRNYTGPYYYGSVVQLTAIAEPNWEFSEWSGDYTGTDNPATIIITGNMNITARFTGQKYIITASVTGVGGTIQPSGSIIVTYGQNQTFTITPDVGYHVSDVIVDHISIGPVLSYTFYAVDNNHTITAVFAQNEYTLTVNIIGGGSVTKNPDKPFYAHGEAVQLTATANLDWAFSGWSGAISGLTNPITITITDDTTISATFTLNNWWNRDWQYRRTIVIDHTKVSGTQTNFPVLIEIFDSSLTGKTQPNGYDFVFTDTNNVKLDHQIEFYDSSTGHLIVWVKVPFLSSTTDTILYMYYGNPTCGNQQNTTAVWDTSNKLVLHLNENAGIHYDSTINGNNGTPFNGVIQGVSGKIDGADTFDGTNDYIQIAHSGSLAGYTEAFTLSFWVKFEDTSRRQTILGKYNTGTNQRGWFVDYNPVDRPTRPLGFYASADGTNYREWYANFVPTTGIWYYVTIVWETNTIPKFYINGAQVSTVGTATIASIYNNIGVPLLIGRCQYNDARYFRGSLDEIRISNPARSAGYILTSYNNQLNPAAFYSIGAEETFEESYVLTIIIDGYGSVTVDPNKTSYEYGEIVTLTATPEYGYQFQGWSGDLTGTDNPAYVTMTKNMIITAHFAVKQYTITASVSGIGGTIEPSGEVTVSHGEDKTFTMTPAYGYHILDVLVDGESQGAITTYTFYAVNMNHTITAFFAPNEYTLTVNVSPEGSGTVTLNNTGPYYYGDAVQLFAEPNTGWYFSQWIGNFTGNQNPATITIDGDKTITAIFTQELYVLNITISGNGNVTKYPDKTIYVHGETVTLTANADLGWTFTGWSGDASGNENQIIITMDGNKSITATFTENLYTLTIYIDGNGNVSKNPENATYTYGAVVELTATAELGWTFSHWSGALSGSDNPTSLTITENTTVTAHFTQNQYTLTINIIGEGNVNKDPLQETYTYGQTVTLTAIPNEGWNFSGWSGDINGTDYSVQITIDDNKTITATFIHVNRPPQIDSYTPTTDPTILEGDQQEFTISPSDPDGDDLLIQWYINDTPTSTENTYTFRSNYASAGIYNVTVTVTDGLEQATHQWTLTITDVGPVLDTPFDTDTNPTPDNSGYGNNGTVNGATWTTAGNGSYYFDGNDYIRIEDNVSLDGDGNWDQLTIEFWLYITAPNQNGKRIIAKRGSTSGTYSYQVGFQTANGRLYFDVWNPNLYEVEWTTLPSLNTWYHIVCVYKSGEGSKIYINGVDIGAVKVGTGSESGNVAKSRGQALFLGCRYGTQDYFTGIMDNVKIFFKGLPIEQIVLHYDASKDDHVNKAPIITSFTPVDPEPQVDEGQSLQFTHTSIDPERNLLTYSWLLDGVQNATTQNWIYQPSFDDAGVHNVTLVVSDGNLITTQYWNVTVRNVNRAPIITNYYPDTDPMIPEGQSQEFNITCSDPDGDNLLIQWYLGNTPVGTQNSTSYTFSGSAGTYDVSVQVSDGLATIWHNWTLTVTSGNIPPSIESVTISPKPAYNDNTLTATPYGWNDPDGDPEDYIYQWQKWTGAEWQNMTDATNPTLDPSNFANGDQIRVMCTPYDGKDYGETKYDTVTIENRPPTISDSTPSVSYPCINQGNQQEFTVTATDPDNDPLSYEWYLNGALTSTTTSYTFDAVEGTSGVHNITVAVKDNHNAIAKRTWLLTVDANLVMPFDTNIAPVTDYAGYDNNGTINGATWTPNGKIGGAYIFDGNDYIRIEDSPNIGGDGTWTEITIEFWIYVTQNQRGTRIIAKRGSTTGTYGYQIGFQSSTSKPYNTIYFDIWNAAGTLYETEYQALSLNTWYYIVCTYNSTEGLKLYIDGILRASLAGSGNIHSSTNQPLFLGCRYGTQDYFIGLLDEVRIYPKVLMADQINQSYYQTKNLSVDSSPNMTQSAIAGLMYFSIILALPMLCCALFLSKTKRKWKLNRLFPTFYVAKR